MNEPNNIRPVKPDEGVTFRCQLCGACCRQVKDSVMLEPMDIYLLARFLRERGEKIDGPEDVLAQYTHADVLADRLPIFLLNTVGSEHTCVFLKNGRCSVYDARPRTCRLYPFTVAPGSRGRDFLYYLCTERLHHLTGGKVLVKDWMYQNFSKDARRYLKAEYEAIPILGKNTKEQGERQFKSMLFQFLFYRYYNYDLDQPFLPQFLANTEKLKELTAPEAKGG